MLLVVAQERPIPAILLVVVVQPQERIPAILLVVVVQPRNAIPFLLAVDVPSTHRQHVDCAVPETFWLSIGFRLSTRFSYCCQRWL